MELSPQWTAASGRLADLVYSRNPHGPYTRPYVVPNDPATPQQRLRRQFFATLAYQWGNTLTQAQRLAWAAAAQYMDATDSLGVRRRLSGREAYFRVLTWRRDVGHGNDPNPPLAISLGQPRTTRKGYTAWSVAYNTIYYVSFVFNLADPWSIPVGAGWVVQRSPPVSLGTNFFAGPWVKFASDYKFNLFTPLDSPHQVLQQSHQFLSGERYFFRVTMGAYGGWLLPRHIFRGDVP